ncbi:hypothetical protein [Marinobacterium aestuariivivens]|uniref:Helix-turn-helix domain-containing protein n=1 Tax=Marinobacterium aestuariivivens TaxID=1698799 RepID=A0ABW1ZZ87_9GAMM
MHSATTPNNHLKSQAAANYLLVAESTLRKSRVTGILCGRAAPAYIKMGRTVLYTRTDLDAWVAELPKGNCTAQTAA